MTKKKASRRKAATSTRQSTRAAATSGKKKAVSKRASAVSGRKKMSENPVDAASSSRRRAVKREAVRKAVENNKQPTRRLSGSDKSRPETAPSLERSRSNSTRRSRDLVPDIDYESELDAARAEDSLPVYSSEEGDGFAQPAYAVADDDDLDDLEDKSDADDIDTWDDMDDDDLIGF